MASKDEARLKQIRIKTGVVKRRGLAVLDRAFAERQTQMGSTLWDMLAKQHRLTKEKAAYEKEVEIERRRVSKLKEEGGDSYVIKKQEEALQETIMMIPNSARLLSSAVDELAKALNSEKDLSEQQLYKDAQTVVEEAQKVLAVQDT